MPQSKRYNARGARAAAEIFRLADTNILEVMK